MFSHTFSLSGGSDIFFTDSGAPAGSTDYTTLIVLHGSAFNGHSLEILHDYAHKYNLRTVIWNRREYPGSTKYTDAELEDYNEGRKAFLDGFAIQVCEFLKQYVERENIPKISADRNSGGFAIMGWSMGTATAMPLFSDPTLISAESYILLEQYVKDLILYDPPYLSFGYEPPADPKAYNVWADPAFKTPKELYHNFALWVSSFFDHPGPDVSGSTYGLNYKDRSTDSATVSLWTQEEFERNFSESAVSRSEFCMFLPPMQTTLREMTNRVLFDEKLTQTFFPKVPVTYISASRSNWTSIWGTIEAKKNYKTLLTEGKKIRSTSFVGIDRGNHFVHWHLPKEFIELTAAEIRRNPSLSIRHKDGEKQAEVISTKWGVVVAVVIISGMVQWLNLGFSRVLNYTNRILN